MEEPKERLTTCISAAELDRRWKAAREIMHEEKIDFLIMQSHEGYLGGYTRWFSDHAGRHCSPFTVIFAADEEMTLITSGPAPPAEPFLKPWAVRGVKKVLAAPYIPSVGYTNTWDAELAVGALRRKKAATVGLVGKAFLPAPFCEHLRGQLPDSRFVDVTDSIDRLKAIKSPEEIELIRRTAEIQDVAMEHVRKSIRPGRRDYEILAEAQYSVASQGSDCQLILVGSAPPGSPVRWHFPRFQNRMIREGDQVSVLIEVNGPGGFYTEIGRLFSLGEPSQEWQDAFAVAVEAQESALRLLKPGADPKDIWDGNNAFLQKRGYRPERRLFAHGQGYDLVERPALRPDEPMKIEAGMNINVHPCAITETVWATVCDNYIVAGDGVSPCLHRTPKEILIV